jgi:hypothetical protein
MKFWMSGVFVWLVVATASAQRDEDKPPFAWDVLAGSVASSADGARWIGTSDAGSGEFSRGHFRFPRSVRTTVEISVRARRLSADTDRPIEIYFPGGAFGVASNGQFFFWGESDARWSGWQSNAAITNGANLIQVRQSGRHVEGYVNGVMVGTFELELEPVPAAPSVFFKGNSGQRSRIEFWDFTVRELGGRRPRIRRAPSPAELQAATRRTIT